jgi:hypothetical protein
MYLNDSLIRNARPGGRRRRKLSDDGGLYLLLQPTGARWWRMLYSFQGKSQIVHCALRLLPLIFVRCAELRYARWDEFELATPRCDGCATRRRWLSAVPNLVIYKFDEFFVVPSYLRYPAVSPRQVSP